MNKLDGIAASKPRFPTPTALLLACLLLAAAAPLRTLAQLPNTFSQSALNAINSDLSSEILAGSTNTGAVASPFYLPTSNLNMLPNLVGSTGTGGLENLLKVSIPSPFFSGSTYSTTGVTRASPALTTGTSLDGRYFTPALWNAPLLLPVTSGTDYTPLLSTGTFTVPNWILVARDGSNPTTWSPALLTSSNNSSTVTGRYAYTIYHEGGLLDANVAGYPSTSSTFQIEYKPALPYADLTQIGLTPSQIDTLVGWRNYASTQAPGTPTAPDFTAASGSNYYQFVLSNTDGYLTPSTAEFNGQTDQMFTSRQQLIDFMQNSVGLTGTGLDALNYLATFTRGVNQPSFSPDPTRPLIVNPYTNGGNNVVAASGTSYEITDSSGNYDPINPSFLTVLVSGTFTRNDGSTAVVGEPLVNKRFALNRLAWLTYLGPSAYRYIPTTNPGPSDTNYDMWQLVNVYGFSRAYLAQGTAANIQNYFGLVWALDAEPSSTNGGAAPPASFHDDELKWFYMGHNTAGSVPGTLTASNTTGSVSRLQAIANLGSNARDPDFFELLKAGVMAGSKAKASMNLLTVASDLGTNHPYYYQGKLDTNLDYSIIQLGANIIDQFKVDGYSTRIVFNDGVDSPHELRGVENLPYLYRVNTGTLKLRMENPQFNAFPCTESATLKDPGVAMIMQIPTIWNPYDENAPLGDPAPAGPNTVVKIRLIADSTAPDELLPTTTSTSSAIVDGYSTFNADGYDVNQLNSSTDGYSSTKNLWTTGTDGAGVQITPPLNLSPPDASPLVPSNTQMTFVVPNAQLFREPTPLAMSGLPAGSSLQMAATLSQIAQSYVLLNQTGRIVYSNTNGFLSDSPNPLDLPSTPLSNQAYVGVCLALYPVEFATGSGASQVVHHCVFANLLTNNGSGPYITYRLQYQDPNPSDGAGSGWVTYDEKYTQINSSFLTTPFDGFSGDLANQAEFDYGAPGECWQSYVDPRTSRFAAINGRDLEKPVTTPGGSIETGEWADSNLTDGVGPELVTDRPDNNAGYPISINRPGAGAFPEFLALSASGWTLSEVGDGHFRTGMLSQNSDSVFDNGLRFNGDNPNNSTTGDGPQPTYYADPDGVVRGAMGNYQTPSGTLPATDTVGLPLATAYPAGTVPSTTGTYQAESRPHFLHRPFRSVAELGYAFSGTP